MEREKFTLTENEATEILWGDSEEFEIISDVITSTGRWTEYHRLIVKRLSDGKFFKSNYQKGLTEQQDESPYENTSPDFIEVFPVEKTITVYE